MYVNKICAEIQIQCGECDRVDRVMTQLSRHVPDRLMLLSDSIPVPAGWVGKQVDRDTWELFCSAHHRDVRL